MRYKQQYDGDWITPIMRGYRMKCCSCGLVHRINFKIVKQGKRNKLMFEIFKVEAKT